MRKSTLLALTLALLAFIQFSATAKTYNVSPGMSIQDTLDKVAPGDTVQVYVGNYEEELTLRTDNVSLIGLVYQGERPVLDGMLQVEKLEFAITIEADNVTVEGFLIHDYLGSGIRGEDIKGVTLRDLVLNRTGNLGIGFENVSNVVMDRVITSVNYGGGAMIVGCIGYSITNSRFLLADHGLFLVDCVEGSIENSGFTANRIGIFVVSSPDSERPDGDHLSIRYCQILNNRVHRPNSENKDDLNFPAGIGIAIVGNDHTSIRDSVFSGNETCAIATFSAPDATPAGEGEGDIELPGIPDHTFVTNNTYIENGTDKTGEFARVFEGVPPCDLYWDRSGIRNQWQENDPSKLLTTHPENLISEQGGVHTNVIHFL